MHDIKIHIQRTCDRCKGAKVFPNTDEETMGSQPFNPCIWCDGEGHIDQWISAYELLELLGLR
jgi:DnaJ-class molecular chaperone